MNVVILNDAAYVRGGADRVALDSARALSHRGHQVHLLSALGPVDPALASIPGLAVTCLGSTWIRNERGVGSALRALWNHESARRLEALLAAFDPNDTVVHAHLYSSALSASVLDRALTAGFPTLLTLHDYFITCPNGAYFVFPEAKACDRRALSTSCLACNCDSRRRAHKLWRVLRTWRQSRVAHLPDRLTGFAAVSETCAALARRDLPTTARIEVVPNIVAIDRAPPVDPASQQSFIFAGRLESYKGPQLLAQAAARLGLPAVFCGAGPMEGQLRRTCPHARFTGWLSPQQVTAEVGRARAFVFPSVYRETFGLSAAEALAQGVPVVASRGTAAEEFVHHGRNGLLFAHNSVDDLTAQLAALAADSTVRSLGAAAYTDYWAQPLTVEAHVNRLERFYQSALGWHRSACISARSGLTGPLRR